MSALKPGTRCVIIAGCPENIGLLVVVLTHIGKFLDYEDAYRVKTLSGRPMALWADESRTRTVPGASPVAVTERWKLRPLVDEGDLDNGEEVEEIPKVKERAET